MWSQQSHFRASLQLTSQIPLILVELQDERKSGLTVNKARVAAVSGQQSYLCRARMLPRFLYRTMPVTNVDESSESVSEETEAHMQWERRWKSKTGVFIKAWMVRSLQQATVLTQENACQPCCLYSSSPRELITLKLAYMTSHLWTLSLTLLYSLPHTDTHHIQLCPCSCLL